MKKIRYTIGAGFLALALGACGVQGSTSEPTPSAGAEILPSSAADSTQNTVSQTETTVTENASDAMVIEATAEGITVDGTPIASDTTSAVYLQDVVEIHPDVAADLSETINRVITITHSGTYSFSGTLEDGQIRVDLDGSDTGDTVILLNGITITNRTAPGIVVMNAADPQEAGRSSVTLRVAEGTENNVTGSHVARYTDETGVERKYDGAISADVSLTLSGTGTLNVNGDKEGIESKLHLTIEEGDYNIYASDDSLNASEDGVSVITINGGHVLSNSTGGEEGDGIDSNGSIVINGGDVVAVANENSMDSGLDSDLGITINGGRVVSIGNMYDEVLDTGAQTHITLNFATAHRAGDPVVLLNEQGDVIFAYTPSTSGSIMVVSVPELSDGQSYSLYTGGTVTGTENDGLYSLVEAYTDGTQMQHGGAVTGGFGGPGGRGGGGRPAGGNPTGERPEMPADFDPSAMPEGQPPEMPQTAPATTANGTGTEVSTAFVPSAESRSFSGVQAAT